jgi:glycosyltransferase involved in cell wall biosynthesis
VIVGSGDGQSLSIEPALRERAARVDLLGRVSFTGRVDAVEYHLRACDLLAFPSTFEALGLSLIEAAACGLPAVASRTGGIVDVVEDGASGLLVAPGSVAELRGALAALLDDPERRRAWGRHAREIAERRFDLEASVGRYRALFAGLGR